MEQLILASAECDLTVQTVCAPADVRELFEFREAIFQVAGFPITRLVFLIFLAAALAILFLWVGLRRKAVVPGRLQVAVEALVGFVRDEIAVGIIGPDGIRYFPYLLALFMFILVGNLFEITPFVNMPITSRIAIPMLLALLTWAVFVAAGFKRQGLAYLGHILWPPGLPIALRPLVGIIEVVSIFLVRPFSLAVRLFANLVAGHVMLTLLLLTGFVSLSTIGDIGALKGAFGIAWWALGIAIFLFELVVIFLQAYIFTLLSAVYIETSLHPEH